MMDDARIEFGYKGYYQTGLLTSAIGSGIDLFQASNRIGIDPKCDRLYFGYFRGKERNDREEAYRD